MSRLVTDHLPLLAGAPNGVKRLRELILELAVRGKLVAQDPGDEPVDTFLKRIAIDKEKFLLTGRAKKFIEPTPVDKEMIPFVEPAGWVWASFGQITKCRDGERIPVAQVDREQRAKTYDYYGASGVIDKIDDYLFDKPLLLIGEDGANLLNRSTPIAFIAQGKYWVNNHAHVIDGVTDNFLKYIELYINAIDLAPYVTGTAQPKMNQAKMNSILVALPPEEEQNRIVAKVDELMALCDRLETRQSDAQAAHARLVDELLGSLLQARDGEDFAECWGRVKGSFDVLFTTEQSVDVLRNSILQLGVFGRLGTNCAADEPATRLLGQMGGRRLEIHLEPLPENWCWTTFSAICKIKTELVRPEDHQDLPQVAPDCIEKGTGRLIVRRTVRQADVRGPNSRFSAGQIIYSKIRPSLSKAILVDFSGLCSADMYPINSHIDPRYQLFLMLSEPFLAQVRVAENRVKMPKLNQESLNEFRVPLPPLAEQRRIVAKVTEFLAFCDKLKTRIATARAKHAQLAEALTSSLLD
jgi:type I restriction enzyme, S subunit